MKGIGKSTQKFYGFLLPAKLMTPVESFRARQEDTLRHGMNTHGWNISATPKENAIAGSPFESIFLVVP